MASSYSVRLYQPGDDEKIASLLSTTFNGWPHFDLPCSPADHWRWKYISSPVEKGTVVVAESGDRIIGCDHGSFSKIKIGDKIWKCRQGVDSAVHPDFRGMGVYSNLDKLKTQIGLESNIGMVFFASSNPIIVKHDAKIGSEPFPKPIHKFLRVKDVDLFVGSLKNKDELDKQFLKLAVTAAKAYNKLMRAKRVEIKGVSITDLDRFDEQVNVLWDSIKNDYSFITERKMEYLNWRYCDPRGGVYSVKQAVQDGEMLGYIVLRINTYEGAREGFIVDVLTKRDRVDIFKELVSDGLSFFDEAGVNVVHYCGVVGHPYVENLEGFGFLDARKNVNVYYGKRGDDSEFTQFETASPKELLLHYGDLDWI